MVNRIRTVCQSGEGIIQVDFSGLPSCKHVDLIGGVLSLALGQLQKDILILVDFSNTKLSMSVKEAAESFHKQLIENGYRYKVSFVGLSDLQKIIVRENAWRYFADDKKDALDWLVNYRLPYKPTQSPIGGLRP